MKFLQYGFNLLEVYLLYFLHLLVLLYGLYVPKIIKKISSIIKFALGLLGAALAFLIMALASNHAISLNGDANTLRENLENSSQIILVSPWWLVSSFLLMVLGELCLSLWDFL